MAALSERASSLPARSLPLLYFAFAHLCLGVAFLLLAVESHTLVGFFYHPRMIAVVHLVTLGWITGSILGALYLVAPIALRMRLPARRGDYWAFVFFAIGTTGMVSHFWMDSYSGMLWSAGTVIAGIGWVTSRVLLALPSSGLPGGVRLHIVLACVNILGAGVIGFLAGLEQLQVDVLPAIVLEGVYAHAHLAALGWATTMVIGVGYRLFPMFLPAAMPTGPWVWASAVLLEAGVLGLSVGFLFSTGWMLFWGICAAAGLVVFFRQVYWMWQHPRTAPPELERPDYGMGHAVSALGFLALATALGLSMLISQPADWESDLAIVYGVVGLLGFLAQMVVGMQMRLLPMFAWLHAYAGTGYTQLPPSSYSMPVRRLQLVVLILWLTGVPALAAALYSGNPVWVTQAALLMLSAVLMGITNNWRVVRHAFRRSGAEA